MKMEMRKCVWFFMLLLILFASQEMVKQVEGRMCESKSHHYRGACWREHNCAMSCRVEGFSGGHCKGFRGRCFCTRRC
ncbi:defensin-like protein 1 [Amaranthus tricolor]|uniref:defensin-like protein 1 n=1 Tax=Amaranthus tricolor TaxID=29722 RepID=UPI002590308E|nr:defensin-like protein 1 [Amaranthus tricolor]